MHILFLFSLPELTKLPSEDKTEPPADLIPNSVTNIKEDDAVTNKKENTQKPCPITRPRYSESEDSDCGLVIDLDRRISVEERGNMTFLEFM